MHKEWRERWGAELEEDGGKEKDKPGGRRCGKGGGGGCCSITQSPGSVTFLCGGGDIV